MKSNDTALRKRTQITKANRMMFIWIALASALVGFAAVTSYFLVQKMIFNETVLSEKGHTIATLKENNAVVGELQTQVRVLDTDANLMKIKARDSDQAIQVILDALPSDANSLALGASLQNKLLAGIPGLTVETIQVDPVAGIESLTSDVVESGSVVATDTANEITFQFSVSGNQDALKQALVNLERSIRTIDILSVRIENAGTTQTMTVSGRAFYEPARVVQLYDKVITP